MTSTTNAIRILLVGEPNVGKTTLILSLVSEEFASQVPAHAEEITIPADVTPERIPTQIVDYSSQTQNEKQLHEELKRADVICLIHALDNETSFERITSYWLPLIRRVCQSNIYRNAATPVVLVGNKLDLKHESRLNLMLPIMTEFSEVETCVECSAKTLLNLSETFWFAQKAVLYPTAPLYKAEIKELTPECIRALTRIFHICDIDNDGYLSDRELESFQTRCFAIPFNSQSLADVKQFVYQSCPGGFTLSGLTVKGFLFLHLMFIQKGRHETTWTVLRQFGYGNDLRLSDEFLATTKITIPSGCSTEISPLGLQFLDILFNKYDLDHDGCLSPIELSQLLATCPEDKLDDVIDMGVCVHTNQLGYVTKQGFVAFWLLTAYLEPNRLMEYLAYFGFTYYVNDFYLTNITLGSGNTEANVSGTSGGAGSSGSSTSLLTAGDKESENLTGFASFWNRGMGGGDGDSRSVLHNTTASLLDSDLNRSTATINHSNNDNDLAEFVKLKSKKSPKPGDLLLRSLIVTTDKRLDNIRRYTSRTVFYCRVYGSKNCGKTSVLQGLLGRSLKQYNGLSIGGVHGRTTKWVSATGISVYGLPRTLLMQEIGTDQGELMSANEALSADVACLVYDVSDPNSFRYVANLFLNFYRGTRVPCLLVAAKSDQPAVIQNYQIDPSELAEKYNLAPPESFSSMHIPQQTRGWNSGYQSRSSRAQTSSAHRRSGSADRFGLSGANGVLGTSTSSHHSLTRNPMSSQDLVAHEQQHYQDHGGAGDAFVYDRLTTDPHSSDQLFAPVYVLLCTMANYPHQRGLDVSTTEHAWKWTLAATILAGFGIFAFRMAKTHLY